ncbi:MAG: efflux RND transporter periplasmic adaptor subunit [Verrucomicrobia bacterium]|nr:efflux RND transporter periplasmic adaptor subunit [Verrucomicrobiota bacterium]
MVEEAPSPSHHREPEAGERRAAERPREQSSAQHAQPKHGKGSRPFFFILAAVALTLLILLGAGLLARHRRNAEQQQTAQAVDSSARTVQVVRPGKSPPTFDFTLPGSAEPWQQATLYARTNGYLKERLADIGDRVKERQLLARIDAPDIDAQLRQAQASLEQSRAALDIARVTFEREKKLLADRVVSRQEYDQNEAAFNQAAANVKAAEANVANLQAQQGFQEIRAPFDGVVTNRFVDVGALIAVGTNSQAPSLFTVSQTDTLRVFIFVPQAYAPSVQAGQEVESSAAEYPKEIFRGKVTRTADALDPTARTERVEIQLSSEGGRLLPGMYLSVRFKVQQAEPALIVPSNTIIIRKDGPQVATVDEAKKIAFKNVALGRDFGTTQEVLNGLTGNEQLIVNPTDDLQDGAAVKIEDKRESKPEAGPPTTGQQPQKS